MGRKVTTELCIQDFIKVHGDNYDYSLLNYINSATKVKIICKIHGIFEQRPNDHKSGFGCRKCSGKEKLTTEECIQNFKKVHGDTYDYSLVEYNGRMNKVKIICKIHGIFEQTPNNHKNGQGCSKCIHENNTLTTEECIQSFIKVHNDTYDYSLVEYIGAMNKVKIICKFHGIFEQPPNSHKKGYGCMKCSGKEKLTTEECIEQFITVHGDTYDYSLVNYISAMNKVKIICKVHGIFEQRPNHHKIGQGCPSCAKSGYDSNKKGYFYIQRLFLDDDLKGIKFGITNRQPEQRMKDQSRYSIYDHDLCYSYSNKDGNIALEIENKVKKNFVKFKAKILKEEMQDGFTETLKPEYLFTLTQYVEKLVKELG